VRDISRIEMRTSTMRKVYLRSVEAAAQQAHGLLREERDDELVALRDEIAPEFAARALSLHRRSDEPRRLAQQ
jgi:hypothetical protein